MKAAIYSPYLDTLGGGERYMMTIAEVLSKQGFDVDVLLDEHLVSFEMELKKNLANRFNLNLTKISFMKAPIGRGSVPFNRAFFLKKYDVLFYLTDGSIFYPTAKKNILHIQSPLIGQPAKSAWGKLKLKGWNLIIYNSNFTKKYSERNWPLNSKVVYPPVDVTKIKPLEKKQYILSVGRFSSSKKHEVMIKVFSDLYRDKKLEDWSLHLIGSASEGDKTYLYDLKEMSQGLPIKFYPNLVYNDLVKLYGESGIYWHGAGYGETDPIKMEHFGISTVEAMAGGCIPVVIGKGGQVEIVDHGESGFLWQTLEELKHFTERLISDNNLMRKMSKQAIIRAKKFDKKKFLEEINKII